MSEFQSEKVPVLDGKWLLMAVSKGWRKNYAARWKTCSEVIQFSPGWPAISSHDPKISIQNNVNTELKFRHDALTMEWNHHVHTSSMHKRNSHQRWQGKYSKTWNVKRLGKESTLMNELRSPLSDDHSPWHRSVTGLPHSEADRLFHHPCKLEVWSAGVLLQNTATMKAIWWGGVIYSSFFRTSWGKATRTQWCG